MSSWNGIEDDDSDHQLQSPSPPSSPFGVENVANYCFLCSSLRAYRQGCCNHSELAQEQQLRGYPGNTRKALCKLPTEGPGGFFQVLKVDQLANPLPN
jgi:hypothetical protein